MFKFSPLLIRHERDNTGLLCRFGRLCFLKVVYIRLVCCRLHISSIVAEIVGLFTVCSDSGHVSL